MGEICKCNSYKDLSTGDPVICKDTEMSFDNITKNKIYYILSIYSSNKTYFFQVIDDDNLISAHKADIFVALDLNRNNLLNQLI